MPLTRTTVFDRVQVDYAVAGGARVSWSLRESFRDLQPYQFQLQVGIDGGSDWEDVGIAVLNGNYAIDGEKRLAGKDLPIAYRVVLTTSRGQYTSGLSQPLGLLSKRQWLLYRAMTRRTLLTVQRPGFRSLAGWLLKRKRHGTQCSCIDPFTGGCQDSSCELCHGTGWTTGYWRAAENTLFNMTPEAMDIQVDAEGGRGTVADVVQKGSFVGLPQISTRDVWIMADSDRRYFVHRVENQAELNQVPVVTAVELRLAELTDVIYTVPLEGN